MTAVILCGGLGTRLQGVLHDRPKCLAPIGGQTYLDILTTYLHRQGVGRFVFATGYRADKVEQWLSSKPRQWDWTTSHEESPLGTGGALRLAAEQIEDDNFLALNADTFLEFDCQSLWKQHLLGKAPVTLVAVEVPETRDFGRLEVANGFVSRFNEKGTQGKGLINGGAYAVQRSFILGYPLTTFSLEKHLLAPIAHQLSVVLTQGAFLDIGTPETLDKADSLFPLFVL